MFVRNEDLCLRSEDVIANVIPAPDIFERLNGASSQCFRVENGTVAASYGSLTSGASGKLTGMTRLLLALFISLSS